METDDNSFCEICLVHESIFPKDNCDWYYWINQHCIDLRRNREARENKNYKPEMTVF